MAVHVLGGQHFRGRRERSAAHEDRVASGNGATSAPFIRCSFDASVRIVVGMQLHVGWTDAGRGRWNARASGQHPQPQDADRKRNHVQWEQGNDERAIPQLGDADGHVVPILVEPSDDPERKVRSTVPGKSAGVSNSTFTGNTALSGGGIANSGTMSVSSTTFTGNAGTQRLGGGIFSSGVLTVSGGTFVNNSSYRGGGIRVFGVAARPSMFRPSSGTPRLIPWWRDAPNEGSVTVLRSTFSSERGLEGWWDPELPVRSWFLTRPSSGTPRTSRAEGSATPEQADRHERHVRRQLGRDERRSKHRERIVPEPRAVGGRAQLRHEECRRSRPSEAASSREAWGTSTGLGRRVPPSRQIQARSTAQDNGGATSTMVPAAGSLLDAAVDSYCSSTDQRGVGRPQGSHCDIGAVELFVADTTPPIPIFTSTPADGSADASFAFPRPGTLRHLRLRARWRSLLDTPSPVDLEALVEGSMSSSSSIGCDGGTHRIPRSSGGR